MRIESLVYLPKSAPRLERGEAGLPEVLPKRLPETSEPATPRAVPSAASLSLREQPARQPPHSYPQSAPQGRVGQALASYTSTANLPLDESPTGLAGLDLYA